MRPDYPILAKISGGTPVVIQAVTEIQENYFLGPYFRYHLTLSMEHPSQPNKLIKVQAHLSDVEPFKDRSSFVPDFYEEVRKLYQPPFPWHVLPGPTSRRWFPSSFGFGLLLLPLFQHLVNLGDEPECGMPDVL
jgi:hypothetical protein